jgi:hypothetical protein
MLKQYIADYNQHPLFIYLKNPTFYNYHSYARDSSWKQVFLLLSFFYINPTTHFYYYAQNVVVTRDVIWRSYIRSCILMAMRRKKSQWQVSESHKSLPGYQNIVKTGTEILHQVMYALRETPWQTLYIFLFSKPIMDNQWGKNNMVVEIISGTKRSFTSYRQWR